MRICLIARNRFHNSRKALAIHQILSTAGHEVEVVAVDGQMPRDPVTRTVPRRSTNLIARVTDRLRLTDSTKTLTGRVASAAASVEADIYLPLDEEVLPAAVIAAQQAGGTVYRGPRMPPAGDLDLIHLAPEHPELAWPVHGLGPGFTPGSPVDSYLPRPGRHEGEKAVICYRKTETNPGRYLEAALVRSGLEVRVETDSVDLSTVDPATRFVLFVESPYPAIEVTGSSTVPVLFWAHHGEHHLNANLRLADRYKADAVLLAHSWHLAPWFPAPVHRFPFAVAPELVDPSRGLSDRKFDAAMVGSNLRGNAWQYQRRREIVEALESHLPSERLALREGVTPEEMAGIYADARIVLDEGGIRHYPITMRVFEAIGSGAVLLTDPAPGLEVLFDRESHYRALTDDVVTDVQQILGEVETTRSLGHEANRFATERHTYDHRADYLLEIAAKTSKRDVPPSRAISDLARLIDDDVEVQRLIHDGVTDLAGELPDREVWSYSERANRLSPSSMDAVVITREASLSEELLETARRYIYVEGDFPELGEYLERRHPDALVESRDRLRRIDLMSESYRLGPAGRRR